MCDEPVQTYVRTEGEWRHFQEYLILQHSEPPLEGVEFRGAERGAGDAGGASRRSRQAEAIVIGPSNPIASIGPMLAVPGMREALADTRCAGRRGQPAGRRPLAEGPDRGVPVAGPATPVDDGGIAACYAGIAAGHGRGPRHAERARLDDGHRAAADRHPDAGRRGARAARERGDRVRRCRSADRFVRAVATAVDPPREELRQAKQRLGEAFGGPERAVLAAAMFEDVLDELAQAALGPLVVVSGEPRALARAVDAGASTRGRRPRRTGSPRPRSLGLARARELGCERALLVPGDCPLSTPRELRRARGPRASRSTSRSCPTGTAPARTRWRSPPRASSSRSSDPGSLRAPRGAGEREGAAPRGDSSALAWSWTSTPARTRRRSAAALARIPGRAPAHARGARPRRRHDAAHRGGAACRGLPEVEPGDDLAALIVGDRSRHRRASDVRGREPEGRLEGRGPARAALAT